jgi:hypothetical protein
MTEIEIILAWSVDENMWEPAEGMKEEVNELNDQNK